MTLRRLWDRICLPVYAAHYWFYFGGFERFKQWIDAEYDKAKRDLEEARGRKRDSRGTDE